MRKIITILSFCLASIVVTAQTQQVNELVSLAKQGNAEAQFNLGELYYYGYGVEQSYTQSVHWYRKAAEQGFAEAQFNLGNAYYNGEGVERSYTQAMYWWRKACENGLDESCNFLNILKQK